MKSRLSAVDDQSGVIVAVNRRVEPIGLDVERVGPYGDIDHLVDPFLTLSRHHDLLVHAILGVRALPHDS
jgi:hypothetical protein